MIDPETAMQKNNEGRIEPVFLCGDNVHTTPKTLALLNKAQTEAFESLAKEAELQGNSRLAAQIRMV